MEKENKKLKKELESLGILNIEADGIFSEALVKEAIDAVKETNLDIKSLSAESKRVAVSLK